MKLLVIFRFIHEISEIYFQTKDMADIHILQGKLEHVTLITFIDKHGTIKS